MMLQFLLIERTTDYRIQFWEITKIKAVNRTKNAGLSEKMDNHDDEKNIYYSDVKKYARDYD